MKKSKYYKSIIESERFNMNISRGSSENIELKEIHKEILKSKTDIFFLRIPSSKSNQIQNLSKLGYEFFQSDTLVYYYVDFEKYTPKQLRNDNLSFKKASIEDIQVLSELVSEIFVGYTNHYFSNKYLNKEDIITGYTEWVLNFLNDENKEVFIINKEGSAIAFATCSLEDDIAEGVLYGVSPSSSGGGVYSDMIRYTQKYFSEKGIKQMKVSTQVQNYAVQKVWGREGFYMKESFATIHINTLLNYSKLPIKEYELLVTNKNIETYADVSKDYNKIHFDDEKAVKCGFKSKIAHGLLASGEISRIFGTDFPGEGTIFMNYKNIFLAPLYPNNTYKFILSTPYYNEKGIYLCLVKVIDLHNNIVMLSYNQLIKK